MGRPKPVKRQKARNAEYYDMLVTVDVHRLLHATQENTIQALLKKLNLTSKQKAKLNYYREKAGLMGI